MEDELRDMKAHKAYYNMLHFVSEAQQGIPKLCPCGSITKEFVDEDDTYDYLPGKRYFICTDYQVRNPEERPVGVKAAKAAKKRKKTGKEEELAKLESLLEIKKQISKQSLLESLLAKSEPLSEMESALKMKLLSELL
ncbi:hypothetical protein YC2023_046341 [Brassica napus]